MRKTITTFCLIISVLSFASIGYCEDVEMTNETWNGRFVMKAIERGDDFMNPTYGALVGYCGGLGDAFGVMGLTDKLEELYGKGATRGEILEAIILYYKNNPTKRNRQIIEVYLSGAK